MDLGMWSTVNAFHMLVKGRSNKSLFQYRVWYSWGIWPSERVSCTELPLPSQYNWNSGFYAAPVSSEPPLPVFSRTSGWCRWVHAQQAGFLVALSPGNGQTCEWALTILQRGPALIISLHAQWKDSWLPLDTPQGPLAMWTDAGTGCSLTNCSSESMSINFKKG